MRKLSAGIVANCAQRGVQALVLGQNKGWKDGLNHGRKQNRRFGRIPIARLIELIRYKAEALGIVVVTTEESYTSKTSFVANEPLRVFDEKRDTAGTPAALEGPTPASAVADAPKAPEVAAKPAAQGKRLKHDRHTFVNLNQTGRWARVHADVNAAFNMLRKVLKSFAFHAGLTLAYEVLRVSPRLGLVRVRI